MLDSDTRTIPLKPTRPSSLDTGHAITVDCRADETSKPGISALLNRLEREIDLIEGAGDCRVAVFEGLGSKEQERARAVPDFDTYSKRERVLRRLRDLAPLSLALVDGDCSAIHLEIAFGADLCIASPGSRFAFPELIQGYLPGMAAFQIARQIGLKRARRLMLLDGFLSADEALELGLIDEIAAPRGTAARIKALAEQVCPAGAVARQLSRRLLEESYSVAYEDSVGHFLAAQNRCYTRLSEAAK